MNNLTRRFRNLLVHLIFVLFIVGFVACEPEKTEISSSQSFEIDFSDSSFISLWYAQFEGDTAMISTFLRSSDPLDQYAALMTISTPSIPKWTADLIKLLNSPYPEIRKRAIFALGQRKDQSVLQKLKNAFDNTDSLLQNMHYNATVIEAVGKIGGPREAIELIQTSTYTPRDSLLNLGRMRGLYQIALSGHRLPEVEQFMINVIGQPLHPRTVHYAAADYLARFSSPPFDSLQFSIIRAFERTEDAQLKRQLARLLPKCKASKANELLMLAAADKKADPTVRTIAARALMKKNQGLSSRFFKLLLEDENQLVSNIAATYYLKHGNQHDALQYVEWAKKPKLSASTKCILLSAALEHLPFYYQLSKNNVSRELLKYWSKNLSRSERKVLIRELTRHNTLFDDLIRFAMETDDPITSTDILFEIKNQFCSDTVCTFTARQVKQLNPHLRESLKKETGSQTLSAEIAKNIASSLPSNWPSDSSFVLETYNSLDLPRQIEAAKAIEELMDVLEIPYEKRDAKSKAEIYPRIWSQITDSTRMVVELPQGEIKIRFLPREAPLTVAQIIAEVQSGFYDEKLWHRVVPNFVVQTGCPAGHGFESGDELLPTEVSPNSHYHAAGACGMASIGPNTESTQWFITFRATPHLDGKYTKWGQVTSGLNHLWKIRADDKINAIRIENLSK
ncbi:MAG: hypothetical protein GVX96_04545 [Bacteroidetes bacterium]|jgi:cyclophilin family peptidyl-prolyl cis-trans isomerase/HEAT repeat protein|nr:hypothetical protein [Bacteroidota bacterium]